MQTKLRGISFGLGSLLVLLVVFSNKLGLSNGTSWGAVRTLLFGLGILLAGFALLGMIYRSRLIPESARLGLKLGLRMAGDFFSRLFQSTKIGAGFAALVLTLLVIFSVWYASLGLFPEFPKLTNLYIDQAEAFLHGQVALLIKPGSELMALTDPYNPGARDNVDYLWDASYYRGNYYTYWGPVPALIFAAIEGISGSRPAAPLLVLLAVIGQSAVVLILLWQIRKSVYPHAPPLSIGLFLLVVTINLPTLFLLGRGRVYETSIGVGQFFLVLGLLGWFLYGRASKTGWLVLAGLSWGLAALTRYNLVVSVAIYLAFVLPALWKAGGFWNLNWRAAAALLVPLAACGLGQGVFNWIRFGNPFETGLGYQLTAPVYLNHHFSGSYFLSNVYLYLAYPYMRVFDFPVIRSINVIYATIPAWAALQTGKKIEEVVFSVRTLPILWLFIGLLPLQGMLSIAARVFKKQPSEPAVKGWPQLAWMIALGGAAQLIVVLFYYYTAVRFMADFYLPLLLTVVFLLWKLDSQLQKLAVLRVIMWAGVGLVVLWTAGLSFWGGLDNPPQVFAHYNPALQQAFAAVWNSFYASPGILGSILHYALNHLL